MQRSTEVIGERKLCLLMDAWLQVHHHPTQGRAWRAPDYGHIEGRPGGTHHLLSLHGISPEVVRAVQIEERDTVTPQSQALIFAPMLPCFIIFAIFNGAAPLITDATADERERESLEPLLINPLPRDWFAVGKMLTATPFATLNLAITLAGFAVIFRLLPVEECRLELNKPHAHTHQSASQRHRSSLHSKIYNLKWSTR